MKTTMSRSHLGFILAALAATAFAADEVPVPKVSEDNPAAQKPSVEVSKQLNAALPKYDPNPAPLPVAPAEPKPGDPIKVMTREDIARAANPDNAPDVLVLPTMKVKQKPRPRLTPDLVATPKAAGDNMLKKSTQLDQALNKYTLPLFGTSAEERAKDENERAKRQQLNSDVSAVAKALDAVDPAEAKALRKDAAK
jgi:hypothetical protein